MSGLIAAGTVLWRPRGSGVRSDDRDGVEVAVIHRPKYDDWSLPKGKCEPGESTCVTAVRETLEETGFSGPLSRGLGEVAYEVAGHDGQPVPKVVQYWAMPALGGAFTPNTEVDELRWLAPEGALEILTREADRGPLQAFLDAPAATATVLLIRHADAGDRPAWKGPDSTRPLSALGREQATNIAVLGSCFGVTSVLSADVVRCVETVSPLATALGLSVEQDPTFAEAHPEFTTTQTVDRIRGLSKDGPVAICSQGGIIPDVLELLRRRDEVRLQPRARKGSVWVLSFAAGTLVGAQYLPSAEPVG